MNHSFKYPCYPTPAQEEQFAQWFGNARFVHNHFTALNRNEFKDNNKFIFWKDLKDPKGKVILEGMSSRLTKLKKTHSFLKISPSQTLQQDLMKLEVSLKAVLKQGAGLPGFRCRGKEASLCFPEGFRLSKHHVRLPKLKGGDLRFDKYRPFIGKPRQLLLTKEIDQYYVVVVCERQDRAPLPPSAEKTCGIDVGVVVTATVSDGSVYHAPDLTKVNRQINTTRRELDRRTRKLPNGKLRQVQSRRREKTGTKLAKQSRHGKNKRKDSHFKYAHQLGATYDHIVHEDLNIAGLTASASGTKECPGKNVARKKGLNRKILGQAWGILFLMIAFKLKLKGGWTVVVDPRNTSRACSACGHVDKRNRRSQSEFVCVECGHAMNADLNAAINIRALGLKSLGLAEDPPWKNKAEEPAVAIGP